MTVGKLSERVKASVTLSFRKVLNVTIVCDNVLPYPAVLILIHLLLMADTGCLLVIL